MEILELVCTKKDHFDIPNYAGYQYSHHVNGVLVTALQMELNSKTITAFAKTHFNQIHFRNDMDTILSFIQENKQQWRRRIASSKANAIANAMLSIMTYRCIHINGFQTFIEFVEKEYDVQWLPDLIDYFHVHELVIQKSI